MKKKTVAFMLRPSAKLRQRLEDAALKYGMDSGQQVAIDTLEQYLDFWIAVQEAKRTVVKRQMDSLHTLISHLAALDTKDDKLHTQTIIDEMIEMIRIDEQEEAAS